MGVTDYLLSGVILQVGLFDPLVSGKCMLFKYDQPFTQVIVFNLGTQNASWRDGRFWQWHSATPKKDEQTKASSSPSFPIPFHRISYGVAWDSIPNKTNIPTPWHTAVKYRRLTHEGRFCVWISWRKNTALKTHRILDFIYLVQESESYPNPGCFGCRNHSSHWCQITCCNPDYQLVVRFYGPRPPELFQALWIILYVTSLT